MLGVKTHQPLFPTPNGEAPEAGVAGVETEAHHQSYFAQTTTARLHRAHTNMASPGHRGPANDDTHHSGGSGVSNLSALDDPTDDFDRVIAQHARDAKRLNDALYGSAKGKAFSKARPPRRPMMGRAVQDVAVEDVRRNRVPEPPVTVPREWGTKGARRDRWLDRLAGPQEDRNVKVKEEEEDDGTIRRHHTASTGDHSPLGDWEVADRPVPSVEDTPPSMRNYQMPSTAPKAAGKVDVNDADGMFDTDDDFAAASMIASTPALSRNNRRIDQLTLLEIEDLQQREVARKALHRIGEHSPDAVRKVSSSNVRARALADATQSPAQGPSARPTTAPARPPSPSKIPKRRRSLYGNKENVPVNGESRSSAGFKASETVGVDRATQAVGIRSASSLPQRPGHERNKSMTLLRTLARVSSMSPSPGKSKAEAPRPLSRGSSSGSIRGLGSFFGRPSSAGSDSGSIREAPEKRPTSAGMAGSGVEKAKADVPERDDASAKSSIKYETPTVSHDDVEQTPSRSIQPDEGKTPLVTGAWVDTQLDINPEPVVEDDTIGDLAGVATHDFSRPAVGASKLQQRSLSEPQLPKSALEAIVKQDREAPEHQYGDSTINSLEGIMQHDEDVTDLDGTIDVGTTAQQVVDALDSIDSGRPLTQGEKDRRQEGLAIEAMNRHLRLARTSIKEADRGMRRVENRVEHLDDKRPAAAKPSTQSTAPPANLKTTTHTPTDCPACGSHNHGAWRSLWNEFTACFYVPSASSPTGLRLTNLGLFLLLTFLWYFIECTLWYASRSSLFQPTIQISASLLILFPISAFYCHQLLAPSMHGDGCDYDAPAFPFVIPTLVFRPVRWVWRPVLDAGMAWWYSLVGPEAEAPVRFPGGPTRGFLGKGGEGWGDSVGSIGLQPKPPGLDGEVVDGASGYRAEAPIGQAGGGWGSGSGKEWGKAASTVAAAAAQTTRRVAQSWTDAVDEVGSMWDDEPA